MTEGDPPPRVARAGRLAFLGLALFGAATVGLGVGGMVGYPLVGLVVCSAYPLWVLVRGRSEAGNATDGPKD